MKGNQKILEWLNKILKNELTAINHYFLHALICSDWGLERFAHKELHESIDEMKHADTLIERILFLEGLPNLQHLEKVRIGEHTEEMMACDMALEMEQLALLREAIAYCEESQDYVSRDILEDILGYEEGHVDWIEAQQYLIDNAGIENYLQAQISDD